MGCIPTECRVWGVIPFSTERGIPDGMQVSNSFTKDQNLKIINFLLVKYNPVEIIV